MLSLLSTIIYVKRVIRKYNIPETIKKCTKGQKIAIEKWKIQYRTKLSNVTPMKNFSQVLKIITKRGD